MKSVNLMVLSSSLALFMACGHGQNSASSESDSMSAKTTIVQGADTTRSLLDKDEKEIKENLDSLIARTGAKIDTLDKKIQRASEKEKVTLRKDKVKMERRRDELKKDLDDVDRKVEADWKEFKNQLPKLLIV